MKNYIQLEIPFEEEEWKDIEGYEGLYQVSDLGRVRSLPRNTTSGKILKPNIIVKGYLAVHLYKNKKRKCIRIHRLVAQAFIFNPNNLPEVNHKDEDKTNNRVENLEWCDHIYNNTYGTKNKRMLDTRNKNNIKGQELPIKQITMDGKIIKVWKSISEASRNGYKRNCICLCCKGTRNFHRGFKWEYV